MNQKQLAWSQNKVSQANNKNLLRLMLLCFGLFMLTNVGMAATGDISVGRAVDNTVILGTVPAIVLGNPVNGEKSGKIIKSYIYVLSAEDVDSTVAFPTKVNREVGNISTTAGLYWRKIEVILDSPEIKWAGSAGDVAASFENSITFTLGGTDDSVMEWLEQRISLGHYVVVEVCLPSGTKRFLIGNGCKPARLTDVEGGSTKDFTGSTVTFKQTCGELLNTYTGNTPILAPSAVTNVATAIALVTGNDVYLIASGTASTAITTVTGTTAVDEGRIITVKGSGGTGPSKITDTADFVLVGGTDWVANANSQISFRIFRSDTAAYKYIEIAGSRT